MQESECGCGCLLDGRRKTLIFILDCRGWFSVWLQSFDGCPSASSASCGCACSVCRLSDRGSRSGPDQLHALIIAIHGGTRLAKDCTISAALYGSRPYCWSLTTLCQVARVDRPSTAAAISTASIRWPLVQACSILDWLPIGYACKYPRDTFILWHYLTGLSLCAAALEQGELYLHRSALSTVQLPLGAVLFACWCFPQEISLCECQEYLQSNPKAA